MLSCMLTSHASTFSYYFLRSLSPSLSLVLVTLTMNFDGYFGHQTPPPESSCRRQNAWLDSKASEIHLKGDASKLAKDARRRRVELRRIRSVSQAANLPDSSDRDVCLKKKRDAIGNTSGDLAPEVDAVSGEAWGSRSYGKISVVGRRREMEDVVAVELGFLKRGEESYDFFGVYDGHGRWRVAHACGQMLHKMLAKIQGEESSEEIDWGEVMAAGFNTMDAEVNRRNSVAVASMRSTAVVAVVGDNEVVVANGGGSRVVLSRGGLAVHLLDGHKSDRGGDELMKREGEVTVMPRTDADEFLILGSQGLWDVVSKEVACQVARRFLRSGCNFPILEGGSDDAEEGYEITESGGAEAAAALLAELAMARGSRDNISIIVVELLKDLELFWVELDEILESCKRKPNYGVKKRNRQI